jgi:hypothetical protein
MRWKDHAGKFGHVGTALEISARVTRLLLATFVVTFLAARIIVHMIAEDYIPNLFLFVGGTHVHHLNYGIYLLSVVGLALLLARPKGHGLYWATIGYGVGLALTFDEFGMWLFLGGSYNNHLTFDAVVIVASILTMLALATTVEEFHPRHWVLAAAVAGLVALLVALAVAAHSQGVMERVFSIRGL